LQRIDHVVSRLGRTEGIGRAVSKASLVPKVAAE
jgi:hypothetical protein